MPPPRPNGRPPSGRRPWAHYGRSRRRRSPAGAASDRTDAGFPRIRECSGRPGLGSISSPNQHAASGAGGVVEVVATGLRAAPARPGLVPEPGARAGSVEREARDAHIRLRALPSVTHASASRTRARPAGRPGSSASVTSRSVGIDRIGERVYAALDVGVVAVRSRGDQADAGHHGDVRPVAQWKELPDLASAPDATATVLTSSAATVPGDDRAATRIVYDLVGADTRRRSARELHGRCRRLLPPGPGDGHPRLGTSAC